MGMAKKKVNRETQLLEIKELLLAEREKILNHLADVQNEASEELEEISGDPADVASVEIAQANRSKLGSRQRKLLSKIDVALEKFSTGDFGICEHTGEEIPIARLRVRPVAQYTVEAKEMLERKERGYRDSSDDDDSFEMNSGSSVSMVD